MAPLRPPLPPPLCVWLLLPLQADILVNMFRSLLSLDPEAVLPAVYLSSNKLSSSFEGVDINLGEASVSAAVRQATGCSADRMR